MFKLFLCIQAILLFSFTGKCQKLVSNLDFYEYYEDFLIDKPAAFKGAVHILKENEEWIEVDKLFNASTNKRIRKINKIWAIKYEGNYYLNSHFTNAIFSDKWFFYKIDSITLNSIFIKIDEGFLNKEGYEQVSYSSNALVILLDKIAGLDHLYFIDGLEHRKLIFFISKQRIRNKFFNEFSKYNYFNDKQVVTARLANYGEFLSLSKQFDPTFKKIHANELDELSEVLQFLDNIP